MYLPRNIIQLFSLHPRCAPQSPPRSFEFFIDLAFSPLAVSHHCIVPIRSSKPILGPILSPWPADESARPFGPILTICTSSQQCGGGDAIRSSGQEFTVVERTIIRTLSRASTPALSQPHGSNHASQ